MSKKILANITTQVILGAASNAYAALTPDSYSMLNGNTGSYNIGNGSLSSRFIVCG